MDFLSLLGKAVNNPGKAFNTALQDIPLISDSIQGTMAGKVSAGPDLIHARPPAHTWDSGHDYNLYQLHQQGKLPVGQPLTNQMIDNLPQNVQGQARLYMNHPTDPRVAHLDPAMFGYAPDNTVPAQHAPQHNDFLSGLMSLLQGNHNANPQSPQSVNPGYIPLQNSGRGPAGYNVGLQGSYNPQGQGSNR